MNTETELEQYILSNSNDKIDNEIESYILNNNNNNNEESILNNRQLFKKAKNLQLEKTDNIDNSECMQTDYYIYNENKYNSSKPYEFETFPSPRFNETKKYNNIEDFEIEEIMKSSNRKIDLNTINSYNNQFNDDDNNRKNYYYEKTHYGINNNEVNKNNIPYHERKLSFKKNLNLTFLDESLGNNKQKQRKLSLRFLF